MARYKSKGIRGNWSEDHLRQALSAVKNGSMKIYTAAKQYQIPRRTLRRYLSENRERKSSLGRKPLLDSDQEQQLSSRIIRLSNVGYPLTPRVLRTCVKRYCDANNIGVNTQSQMIGRDWLRGFMKRHRNIRRRKAQNLNPARAQKLNKFVVSDYFSKLKKIMDENDFFNRPEKIYNIDEKGCQLKLHKAPEVLAERGIKRVHLMAPEHAENVTIVSCGNALGQVIPPMLLFKGKRMKAEWLDSLPPGSVAQMTPKGSMNIEAFVNWMHHFAKFKVSGACLLIFDGAKCHLDDSIVDVAQKYDIKLMCLPSNTTHELQPMDKAVFRSFEYYWDEEVLKYWSLHEDRRITKQRFGAIFTKVWDKALTPVNIKAGFEATGIYPFDPEKNPEEAYAPSLPTQQSAPEVLTYSVSQSTDKQLSTSSSHVSIAYDESDDDIPLSRLCEVKYQSSQADKRNVASIISNTHACRQDNEPRISFNQILKTPQKSSNTTSAPRKKAVNYLALEVTSSTFQNKENKSQLSNIASSSIPKHKQTRNKDKERSKNKRSDASESWYCFLCKEDRVADMRLCSMCASYVHEDCVGLTSKDRDTFVCMRCEE